MAKKPATKSEIVKLLADKTGLTKKQVTAVFCELGCLIKKDLGKNGPRVFVVPGLLKIKVIHKPAVPKRKGINPFTKQEQEFKARPARDVVKIGALKGLKDMV